MCLSTECYAWFTEKVIQTAESPGGSKIISLSEGGYNPEALTASLQAHLEVLYKAGTGD